MSDEARAAMTRMAIEHIDARECAANAAAYIVAIQRKSWGQAGQARVARRVKRVLTAIERLQAELGEGG